MRDGIDDGLEALLRMQEIWPRPPGGSAAWSGCQLVISIFSSLPALADELGVTMDTMTVDDIVVAMKSSAERGLKP